MTTIVMTGGTSGIGEAALAQIVESPGARVILGARRNGRSPAETLALDLGRLESVRSFASDVGDRLGSSEIDALVLNAGLSFMSGDERTPDGFETTFAVNHLAQYLLLRLLMPRLSRGATVVVTTSGTHDPAEKTVIPPPRHADATQLAHPDRDPERDPAPRTAGGRAYSSSKLCNVLTARALAAHPEAEARRWTAIAYDPGPVPGTGLSRSNGAALRAVWWILGTAPARLLIPRLNSRDAAGAALADLALGRTKPPPGRVYAALRRGRITWPEPSELARRDDVMRALWRDSATLVGMPE